MTLTRDRLRTVALGLAVLLSLPNALKPPPPDNHPGFTAAFAWMAIALMPWTTILPFAIMRAKWPVLLVAGTFLGAAVLWRSAPLAAVGCAIAVAPILDELPTSTSLALGVVVIGGLLVHELMPTAKLFARACALVTAALAVAAFIPIKHRGVAVAALAVVAAIAVRLVHQ